MWLTYMRPLPPTEEEIVKANARRAETLRLAAEIEEEERRERSLRISREEDEFPGEGRREKPPEIFRRAESLGRGSNRGFDGRGGSRVVSEWKPESGGGGDTA